MELYEDVQVEHLYDNFDADTDEDLEIQTEDDKSEDDLTELTNRSKLDSHVAQLRSSSMKLSRKYKGAAVCKSKFKPEWQKNWPCITPVKSKPNFFTALYAPRMYHVDTKEKGTLLSVWHLYNISNMLKQSKTLHH